MIVENSLIISNSKLCCDFYRLKVLSAQIAQEAAPGQFVMLKTSKTYDPFLKRPMCISHIDRENGQIACIYAVKGRGTSLLAAMSAGETLEISGPLGHGWQVDAGCKKALLIAGGIGITPLLPLAKQLRDQGCDCHILWGVACKDQLFACHELAACGRLLIATEDGSEGETGFVTTILPSQPAYDMIYCCGPKPLLAAVAAWTETHDLPCQISLEERMGCGLGTCMGCVCQTQAGEDRHYKRICHDGPVFDSREVVFDD
jgi:dihydroorotate dehydrogenase electron transfer subunit